MRLAIVTPWYGRELLGGAERLAWEIAHALVRAGADVDVLATCCKSFLDDWAANYHKSGVSRDGSGVVLHRFPVDTRDRVAFNRANTVLTTMPRIGLRGDRSVLDPVQTRAFVNENINSSALLDHLRAAGASYDAVLFVPYLYGPALSGLPLVADRSFLIPCVHDESYAYLEPVRAIFAATRGVLFNSVGEEETATAIYGPGLLAKSRVIGHAVEPVAPPPSPIAIGAFAPHRSRYVLYLGRQDQSKNIDFLIEAFRAFRERRVASSLQLVLAGPRGAAHHGDGILDLGAVSESSKSALLTYARALAQPSIHESFSRAMYEAWYARRPVLVHGECRATARAVEDSGGGWIGSTLEEWVRMFAAVDESSDEAIEALGERGWAAALDNGAWDAVARRTLDAIQTRLAAPSGPRIDNIIPLGDRAVGRYAQALSDALGGAGADAGVTIAGTDQTRKNARTIAHVVGSSAPVLADLYVSHDGDLPSTTRGRTVFAPSHGIAAQLEEAGVIARVLPQAVSPAVWDGIRPAHERWADGKAVVLSIAPLGPEEAKRLLDTFVAFLAIVRDARLLIFSDDCEGEALATVARERAELDLHSEVVIVDQTPADRYAAYRSATVALAVGRPLTIESAVMPVWFDVPIVALGDVTVMETIEACGLVVDTFDARRIAALVRLVATDAKLRASIMAEGRRVRARHAPAAVAAVVLEHLAATRVASETADVGGGMTPDLGPSREVLVAQIEALKATVERQRLYIGSMRASHFWKLRDAFFALRRRFGNGIEPLPQLTATDIANDAAAFGDPYQLFRMRERRSIDDLDWLRGLIRLLPLGEPIEIIIDVRTASATDLAATMASLDAQVYPYFSVRVLERDADVGLFDASHSVCPVDAGDVLEPEALLSLAIAFNDGADVVYTDEDRFDAEGIPRVPHFKPDWSPETALTRDYTGRLCAFRGSSLAAAGGLEASHASALWYDALLRVTDSTNAVVHVARVLCHRRYLGAKPAQSDCVAAVRRALDRRGERATLLPIADGIDVRFTVPPDERVCVIIPTRDKADLMERCLTSLFERTNHPSFEVIVVDNGSTEYATHALFERWHRREGRRFRVISDPSPFNYSRLNNRAVAETDAPYVVLLNNDTEIIAPDWMTAMLGQARRPLIGAVGALLLYADGTIQHAGVVLGGVLSLAGHAFRFCDPDGATASDRLTLDTNYLAVTGACLMVGREKYLAVGGLDEDLVITYNDIDFCLKLRAAGYRNVMVPRARLYHYESKSRGRDDTRRKMDIAVRESGEIRKRWPEWSRRDPYYNPNLTLGAEDFSVRQ